MRQVQGNNIRTWGALLAGVLVGATIREGLRFTASARPRRFLSPAEGVGVNGADSVGSGGSPRPGLGSPPEEASGPPSSVLGNRIALGLDATPPTLAEMALENAKSVAFQLQQRRGHAVLNDLHGHLSGRPGSRWVAETHGILGFVGEQMLVAIEAEAEKVICTTAIATLDEGGGQEAGDLRDRAARLAHHRRSLRFFAEGQANTLVVACHGLINLVLRSMEYDRPFTQEELRPLRIKLETFAPKSEATSAWVAMSADNLTALHAAAASRSQASQALMIALQSLYSADGVATLINLRNVQYHRWRGETAGVTGLNRGSKTVGEILSSGQVFAVKSGPLLPNYTEGEQTLEELVAVSRRALDAIVLHLGEVHDAWYEAFQDAFSPWR